MSKDYSFIAFRINPNLFSADSEVMLDQPDFIQVEAKHLEPFVRTQAEAVCLENWLRNTVAVMFRLNITQLSHRPVSELVRESETIKVDIEYPECDGNQISKRMLTGYKALLVYYIEKMLTHVLQDSLQPLVTIKTKRYDKKDKVLRLKIEF